MSSQNPTRIFSSILCLLLFAAGFLVAQTINNIPVRIAPQEQILPQAVTLEKEMFIAWISSETEQDRLEYIKIFATGIPDSATLGEAGGTAGRISEFQLASDSPDYFFIAWQVRSQGQYSLNVHKIDKNGKALWANPVALKDNNLNYKKPGLTTDFKNGCYIVWQQSDLAAGDNPADIDIYGQHLDADGNKLWGDKATIINRKGRQILGDIVATSQALGVVWEDKESREVRLGAYDVDSGAAIAGESGIAPGSGFTLYNPKIIQVKASPTDIRDAVIIVWEEDGIFGSTKNIYAQEIDLQGNLQWGSGGKQVSSNSSDPRSPQIFSDEQRGVIIVWQEHGGNAPGIRAQRLDRKGNPLWDDTGTKLADSSAVNAPFSIAHDGKQGVFVTWAAAADGNLAIHGQYLDSNNNLKWPEIGVLISQHQNAQTNPFARLSDNRLFVTWQDSRAVDSDVYAQFILQNGELDNVAPVIYSTPERQALVGTLYSYQLIAADIDQDLPLSYELTQGPAWLSIDSNGLLAGTPPVEAAAPENISIKISDSRGAFALQEFDLSISSNNQPPRFTSIPQAQTLEDSLFQYFPSAEDDDGDSVSIRAISLPVWLKFDSVVVLLSGTPLNEHVGDTVVVLRASDSKGAFVEQKFNLTVLNTNDTPVITSALPPLLVMEDSLYSFQVTAEDEDAGDQLFFALEKSPQWLSIDAQTGLLDGRPAAEDVGIDSVVIVVKDLAGAAAKQAFELMVSNTNDAPQFTSVPVTQAFINVPYQYAVKVIDPDSGDIVFLSLEKAPTWLVLQDEVLQGIPPESANNSKNEVVLRAVDSTGLFAEQSFQIEVSDKPDTLAPAAMVAAIVENPDWSAADSVRLKWSTPQDDGSPLTTLLIKFSTPPQNSLDFDVQSVFSQDGEMAFATIHPDLQGAVPFYCWLADAAGNHDFTTAVQLTYKYDATNPQAAKPLFPNAWARADTLVFKWVAAVDSVSGIENYVINLEVGESMNLPVVTFLQTGDTLTASFPIALEGKLFSWTIEAGDSAGNKVTSTPLFFTVDAVKPFLQHGLIQTASASENLQFVAHATDGISGVGRVALLYRIPGQTFTEVQMRGSGENSESFTYTLPAASIDAAGLEYTIYADDQAGNRAWLEEPNTGLNYKSIAIASSGNPGPKTLKNQYQLISIPYDFSSEMPLSFFETVFSKYTDSEWRLLRYINGAYQELSDPTFINIQPGKGFWLITRSAKSWQTAAVNSVPTDKAFELTLEPGWNIIGNPWVRVIADSNLTIPPNVENALWQWDNGYSLASNGMQPWRGYFIRNNSQQPEKIIFDVTDKTRLGKIRREGAAEAADWLLQLSVTAGKFKDESNLFGIADRRRSASEPPVFSKAPRLYFTEPQQQKELAVSIREQTNSLERWYFTIDNLQPGQVELTLSELQPVADSLNVVLFDRTAGIRREINTQTSYQFLVTGAHESRKFSIEVASGKHGQSNLMPQKLTLEPVWPNPFQFSESDHVRIRFGLPQAARIDLAIYNVLGQQVWHLSSVDEFRAGSHVLLWNGRTVAGGLPASGIYFIRLSNGRDIVQTKIVLIR